MKTLLTITFAGLATATLVGPAAANTPATAPSLAATTASLDIVGSDINYTAAAEAEQMATPTRNFKISARFGQSGPMWSSGQHSGLDFAAPEGTTIRAAESGRVVSSGPAGAYGNLIEIAHGDGTRTRYAHLSDIDVRVGETVKRNQHIGDLGNTGNSSGPHLHFEVLEHGDAVNPEKYLDL
ncbi:MAG: M23 family metallopeptidase [Candidatus Nanopelagicales bacterium]|jgi:murein DD-endopeptidase MepM/ murein hydrolase activator NlpD|nr:M23 family metallopeptidase [Candidatus Nanopelagicales bacterium]